MSCRLLPGVWPADRYERFRTLLDAAVAAAGRELRYRTAAPAVRPHAQVGLSTP
jgi:hypothetical protein